ncbi:MAG: ABC transporter substrate-binding protein, partial [Casimicrobiaceae bacterium]
MLVVSSDDAPQLRAGLIGVREALGTTPVEEIARDGNLKARIEAAALQGENVAVIALGRGAAARAARAAPSIATVDCMAAQAAPGAQAVPLDMPAGPQILWLRRLLPAARYIGILYDPAQNADHVDSLAAALRRADFNPVLVPVAAPAMLPAAVGHLPNAVDALLALPDTTVYTPQTAKGLLLFSFRHKLPLIGPSEAWVKAGALYALVWDYREVGAFCARLALRRLLGAGAAAPP